MLVYGWQQPQQPGGVDLPPSDILPSHALVLIEDLHVGGLIVMNRNVLPPVEMDLMMDRFQQLSIVTNGALLFVAVDQEGGRVNHMGSPWYSTRPSQRELAGSMDTSAVRTAAGQAGSELRAAGLNWDFAPVLDVDNNPNNPVIGDRSFSPDPEICAELGVLAIQGYQQDGGILACGKHFPGHGDTDVDSHVGLPRIDHGRARLDSVELVPFKAAIKAGIAAIMTSHIVFSAIDPDLPATMSRKILTDLLRDELQFKGIIITDCLEMHGVSQGWGSVEAAILAVNAGADMLLCCHTLETQYAIRDGLVSAVQSGRIPMERITESGRRIAMTKAKWLVP